MLVDVAPDKAYIVDIFRVRGGRQRKPAGQGVLEGLERNGGD